jgi:hypothetical protein
MEPVYMTEKDTGGPAFPSKRRVQRDGYLTTEYEPVGGMTLRDYFAAKAMQGLLSDTSIKGAVLEFAARSYVMADAMLAAREVK